MRGSNALQAVFTAYAVSARPRGSVGEVVDALADGTLSIEVVDGAMHKHPAEGAQSQRRDLLQLFLHYLEEAVRDGQLTQEESADLTFLSVCFRLRPGEVTKYHRAHVIAILENEVRRILLDEIVEQSELEYQTALQTILGLGYDEYLELTRHAFDEVVDGWIDRIQGDSEVTAEEHALFDRKMRRLRTVYPLTSRQRRALELR